MFCLTRRGENVRAFGNVQKSETNPVFNFFFESSSKKDFAAQLGTSDHGAAAAEWWSPRQLPRQTRKQNFLGSHQSGFLYLEISDFSKWAKQNLSVQEERIAAFDQIDNGQSWQNFVGKFESPPPFGGKSRFPHVLLPHIALFRWTLIPFAFNCPAHLQWSWKRILV